jgi:hypothetical protein
MRYLRQSTSVDLPIGPFLDATDGVTPETGLTITQPDVRLKKNAAAWGQKAAAQTLTHEENGFYEVTLDATDTDTLGCMRLAVLESGAAPVWEDFMVLSAYEYDRKYTANGRELGGVVTFGTAQGATATTVQLAAAESHANDTMVGRTILVRSSNQLYPQERIINAYDDATDTATVDAFDTTPTGTITYIVFVGAPGSESDPITAELSAAGVDAILDEQIGDSTVTLRQALRLLVAVLGGKASGLNSGTPTYRNVADDKNVVAAVTDGHGNRSSVTRDLS